MASSSVKKEALFPSISSTSGTSSPLSTSKSTRLLSAATRIKEEIQTKKKSSSRGSTTNSASATPAGSTPITPHNTPVHSAHSEGNGNDAYAQRFTSPYKSHPTPSSSSKQQQKEKEKEKEKERSLSPQALRSLSPPSRPLSPPLSRTTSGGVSNLMPLNMKRIQSLPLQSPEMHQDIVQLQQQLLLQQKQQQQQQQQQQQKEEKEKLSTIPEKLSVTIPASTASSSSASATPLMTPSLTSSMSGSKSPLNNVITSEVRKRRSNSASRVGSTSYSPTSWLSGAAAPAADAENTSPTKSVPSFVASGNRPSSAGAKPSSHSEVKLQFELLDKAISSFGELHNTLENKGSVDTQHAVKLLVIGSDAHPLVASFHELNYNVAVIKDAADASHKLRDMATQHAHDDVTSTHSPYDVAFILCDFKSIHDSLPLTALHTVQAAAPTIPIIMVIDTVNENQMVRLLKEGAREVFHPPFAPQIMSSRLSSLFDNLTLKTRFSKMAAENSANLANFRENLVPWDQQGKMRDFQIKVLEEVRTKSENYISMLEDKVKELTTKAEKASQSSLKMKTMNVALKWKMAGSAAAAIKHQQQITGVGTPLQKLMEIATQLDRNIGKDDLKFLLSELNQAGFSGAELSSGLELLTVRESKFDADDVASLEFRAFDHSEDRIIAMVVKIFAHLDLLNNFKISETKFARFLRMLRSNYNQNPYHNFHHVCDVMQMVFYMLVNTDLPCFLSKLDTLSLLLAALCHDVQHPGVTNAFQVNTKSELALLYNDVSVLENHHCSHTFLLLRGNQDNNILENLSESQFKEVRYSMVSSILNTDMARHFELINRFSSIKEKISTARTSITPRSSEDVQLVPANGMASEGSKIKYLEKAERQVLMDTILHAADISNQVRPWEVSKSWSDKLFSEFLSQGDAEKELGLSVSPYMNRENADQQKMSLGFIDFICEPLYSSLVSAFPTLTVCSENLKSNRNNWASLAPSPTNAIGL